MRMSVGEGSFGCGGGGGVGIPTTITGAFLLLLRESLEGRGALFAAVEGFTIAAVTVFAVGVGIAAGLGWGASILLSMSAFNTPNRASV